MNTERLNQLADYIGQLSPSDFNMGSYKKCLAAHAVRLFNPDEPPLPLPLVFSEAQHILDLTKRQAEHLFEMGDTCRFGLFDVRQPDAVRCLRHAATHGQINWDYILEESR